MSYPDMEKVKAAVVRLGLGKTSYTEEKRKKGDKTPVDAGRRKTYRYRGDMEGFDRYTNGFIRKGGWSD